MGKIEIGDKEGGWEGRYDDGRKRPMARRCRTKEKMMDTNEGAL
jgi:hypothetical protein